MFRGGNYKTETSTEADGYTRTRVRFTGRGTRGQPSRFRADAEDVRAASTELVQAHEMLLALETADVDADPRAARERYLVAIGKLELAQRFVDEVLDRGLPNTLDRCWSRAKP